MKIISWNCNGAFRKKFNSLLQYDADIYVIQECENPSETKNLKYNDFAKNYIWIGNKNKGLGIFAKDTIKLSNNNWRSYGLEWFISCTINDEFTLIGLWGSGNYIEDIYVYLQIYFDKLSKLKNVFICGDFNSNCIWDKKHKTRTHSAVVKQLEDINIYSYYHLKENEAQGKEKKPTLYLYRKKERSYHIDYFFGCKKEFKNLEVGKFEDWIKLSDHMPIIVEIT